MRIFKQRPNVISDDLSALKKAKRGASLLEYGMIGGIIAAGSVASVIAYSDALYEAYENAVANMNSGASGGPVFVEPPAADPSGTGMALTISIQPSDSNLSFTFLGSGTGEIYWGDGETTTITPGDGHVSHTYASDGIYTISYDGAMDYYGDGSGASCDSLNYSENYKLVSVDTFGDSQPSTLTCAFSITSERFVSVADIPSGVTTINGLMQDSLGNPAGIETWDVSSVTLFSDVFHGATNFNRELGGWETGQAKGMLRTFYYAESFTSDLSGWDVSNVIDFNGTFVHAYAFNSDVSMWNVSSAVKMSSIFSDAYSFRSDLSAWDVSNVKTLSFFAQNVDISPNVGGWNTSSATNLSGMFKNNAVFNDDISGWDVSNVTSLNGTFEGTLIFDQDISAWDVSNVTNFARAFYKAKGFNQDLSGWTPKIDPSVCGVASKYNLFAGSATAYTLPQPDFDGC